MLDREVDPVEVARAPAEGRRTSRPGRLMPWWEATAPPASTSQRTSSLGSTRARAGGCGRRRGRPRRPRETAPGSPSQRDREPLARRRSPRRSSASTSAPACELDDAALELAEPQLRARAGRRGSRPLARLLAAAARIRSMFSACSSRVAVGEVEPEDVGAGRDQLRASRSAERLAGPTVATILVRRCSGHGSASELHRRARCLGVALGRHRRALAGLRAVRRRGHAVVGCGALVAPRAAGCRAAASATAASSRPAATASRRQEPLAGARAARARRSRAPAPRRGSARRARRARRPSPACSSGSRCARGPGPRSSSRMKQRPSTISVVVAAVRPSSSVPPKTLSTRKNESSERDPDRDPGRDRERGQRAQQPAAVERALARRQGEHERGDPDRQRTPRRSAGGAGTGR